MITADFTQPAQIVRAIDVGCGNTKYVVFHKPGSAVQCSIFPSITPQAWGSEDFNCENLQRRNTVRIEVDGVTYEVGNDARLAQDGSSGHALSAEYSLSDAYLSLVRGAIFYMSVPRIDLLIVGLPVNVLAIHTTELVKRLKCAHRIPATVDGRPSATESVEVQVNDVRVLAQPIGAFFDYSISNNCYGLMKTQMNLVIDIGHSEVDWVVLHGVKIVNARSGTHPGGMSDVLSAIAEAIRRGLGVRVSDLYFIDHALRDGTKAIFRDKEFDLMPYIAVGKEKARQIVGVLGTKVGNNAADIINVILAGGGAAFFKDVIQECFPRHALVVANEPLLANVRGFQLAGTQFASQPSFAA